ncbi:MAG: hypothetical protein R6V54_09260 [Desulfobacteraceae bacterium]
MNIYCFRQSKQITSENVCRACSKRRRCRPFQLWLQPELPFVFKPCNSRESVFDLQIDMKNSLDALFPSEYRLLQKMALDALPGVKDRESTLVRLKMYELLHEPNQRSV